MTNKMTNKPTTNKPPIAPERHSTVAGEVEESSDPLVMFGRGVAHAVSAMILIRELYVTGER